MKIKKQKLQSIGKIKTKNSKFQKLAQLQFSEKMIDYCLKYFPTKFFIHLIKWQPSGRPKTHHVYMVEFCVPPRRRLRFGVGRQFFTCSLRFKISMRVPLQPKLSVLDVFFGALVRRRYRCYEYETYRAQRPTQGPLRSERVWS